jgi:hypothetical protein
VQANIDYITEILTDLVTAIPFLFAVALFIMCALTTSQSATTKSVVPIGIAIGLPAQLIVGMWPSLIGVFFLPANGTQLAAVAADRTGSTKIGNAVVNHSFQPNTIFMWLVSIAVGVVLAIAIHGTGSADTEVDVAPAGEPTAAATAGTAEATVAETPAETPEETPTVEEEATPTEAEAAETPTVEGAATTPAGATP